VASDPTLYRIVRVVKCQSYPNGNMIDIPIYEIVERCEHGKIEWHTFKCHACTDRGDDWCKVWEDCPGSPTLKEIFNEDY